MFGLAENRRKFLSNAIFHNDYASMEDIVSFMRNMTSFFGDVSNAERANSLEFSESFTRDEIIRNYTMFKVVAENNTRTILYDSQIKLYTCESVSRSSDSKSNKSSRGKFVSANWSALFQLSQKYPMRKIISGLLREDGFRHEIPFMGGEDDRKSVYYNEMLKTDDPFVEYTLASFVCNCPKNAPFLALPSVKEFNIALHCSGFKLPAK